MSDPVRASRSRGKSTRRWGLKATGVVALATMVPVALLATVAVRVSSDAIRSQARGRVTATAAVGVSFVKHQLASVTQLADAYARDPELVRAMGSGAGHSNDVTQLGEKMSALAASQDGIGLAFVSDPAGHTQAVYPPSPSVIGKDFSYRDWYRGVKATGLPYVSEAYETAADGHALVIAIVAPVRDFSPVGLPGSILGYVTIGYTVKTIQALVGDFASQQVALTVTDQRGAVIGAPGAHPSGLLSRLADPRVSAALAGRSGVSEVGHGRERVISAFAPVPGLGWTVMADVPASTAYAPVGRIRATVLAVAALLEVMLLAGVGLLAREERRRTAAEEALAVVNAKLVAHRGALVAANERLVELANSDALTGIGNRRRLTDDMKSIQGRLDRYGHDFCIALLDVDHFKAYNDTHGHQAGDLVLGEVGRAISFAIRKGDLAYRYGGDEFLVVYSEQTLDTGMIAAENIRERFSAAVALANLPGTITLSIGVAAADPGDTVDDVIRQADAALYEAKAAGRNQVATRVATRVL
ncbi:MAG TPA: sensor domain-containing diguanylate cyclase [Acidimicrobiales bacterium]|nr:sensor domain-containing diguanylate cyclase [Acidimicrobiales bacterium]